MQKLSVNQLADLTGKDRRTIKKRLGNLVHEVCGKSHLYPSAQALELIYIVDANSNAEELDLSQERARLAHHQANKTDLEEKKLRGELVPISLVNTALEKIVMASRAKILALPSKIAPQVLRAETLPEAEALLKRAACDALDELSRFDSSEFDSRQGAEAIQAAADTDGESVG